MSTVSLQEIFNRVSTHLINQGEKSLREGAISAYNCAYRDGTKTCAAGCLISEEHYSPAFEGSTVSCKNPALECYSISLQIQKAIQLSLNQHEPLSPAQIDLIQGLQAIHDTRPVEKWKEVLVDLGKSMNFSLPAVLLAN